MSELKAVHAFDVYEAYTKTVDDDAAQVYLKSEADKVIAEKDKEIARLDDLAHAHNIELLRKENLIAEVKAKLESVQATAYAESVDAGMENRKLKRAMWLTRGAVHKAKRLAMYELLKVHPLWEGRPAGLKVHKNIDRYERYERKCRAKAEEYK